MTHDDLVIMTTREIQRYARQHYSTIGKIASRATLLAALKRQAEREGGLRS